MAFDQSTRNRLARFVGEARALLTEEFTRQLQNDYGLDPARGEVTDLAKLTQLDDAGRETARILPRHAGPLPGRPADAQRQGAPGSARPHCARASFYGAQPALCAAYGRGARIVDRIRGQRLPIARLSTLCPVGGNGAGRDG